MFQLLYLCYKLFENKHLSSSWICGSGIQMGMACLYFPMSAASDGALEGWICDHLKAHPLTSQGLMLVGEKDFCVIFTWTTL